MELLWSIAKELLGQVAPRYVPVALAGAGILLAVYHLFGLPTLKRRLALLEARAASASQVAALDRKQDALAAGIVEIGKWLGRGGEAVAWHLTYAAAGMIAPGAEQQARKWERQGDQG